MVPTGGQHRLSLCSLGTMTSGATTRTATVPGGTVKLVTGDRVTASSRTGVEQTIRLPTSDGVELEGDLVVAPDAWAGAVVCHPHPAYGGDRHNMVVDRVFRTLAGAGATVLRFDFRRGGDGGPGEQQDALAAVAEVASHLAPGRPLWLVGYSFGADLALGVDDERVAGWVAVAPPLHFGPRPCAEDGDPRPMLVLAAEHDQYTPPDRLRDATATWRDATVTVVPSVDHFLAGSAGFVADATLAWLRDRSSPSSPPKMGP